MLFLLRREMPCALFDSTMYHPGTHITSAGWAKACGIAQADQGTLSSYAWALSVLHYLQFRCHPAVLPDLHDDELCAGGWGVCCVFVCLPAWLRVSVPSRYCYHAQTSAMISVSATCALMHKAYADVCDFSCLCLQLRCTNRAGISGMRVSLRLPVLL